MYQQEYRRKLAGGTQHYNLCSEASPARRPAAAHAAARTSKLRGAGLEVKGETVKMGLEEGRGGGAAAAYTNQWTKTPKDPIKGAAGGLRTGSVEDGAPASDKQQVFRTPQYKILVPPQTSHGKRQQGLFTKLELEDSEINQLI